MLMFLVPTSGKGLSLSLIQPHSTRQLAQDAVLVRMWRPLRSGASARSCVRCLLTQTLTDGEKTTQCSFCMLYWHAACCTLDHSPLETYFPHETDHHEFIPLDARRSMAELPQCLLECWKPRQLSCPVWDWPGLGFSCAGELSCAFSRSPKPKVNHK